LLLERMECLGCLGGWLLCYYGCSPVWLLVLFLLSFAHRRREHSRRMRRAMAERAALFSRQAASGNVGSSIQQFPVWAVFPDKERAESFNRIFEQIWPFLNSVVWNTLLSKESTLDKFGININKDGVSLGLIPPRITGIKVYDEQTSRIRKEIMMDVDFLYAGDLELFFTFKGFPVGISDIYLKGMVRIVLKPLLQEIPVFGGIQIYCLEAPEIEYNMSGIANCLELPGLELIFDNAIIEKVKSLIVFPNKIYLPLVDSLAKQELRCPDTAGVLRVKIICANNLHHRTGFWSVFNAERSPYAVLTLGPTSFRLPTRSHTSNPHWDITHDFPLEEVEGQELFIELYDEVHGMRHDKLLGRAKVQTSVVADKGVIEDHWIHLPETDSAKVQVSLSWLPVVTDPEVVKKIVRTSSGEDTNSNGLVHIYIDSCTGLTIPGDPSYTPTPVVRISSPFHTVEQSRVGEKSSEPVIEQGFVLLVRSVYTEEVRIEILDAARDMELVGRCTVQVWTLLEQPSMQCPLQPRPLLVEEYSDEAEIVMSASFLGLQNQDSLKRDISLDI